MYYKATIYLYIAARHVNNDDRRNVQYTFYRCQFNHIYFVLACGLLVGQFPSLEMVKE